ncbi:hypothetical protein PPTG_07626 [Phytophthora nicotianae INRA-310]|uniref:Uncharacterized protein n=3 Tax=Phytophthora nicotianae TaxID=4792 RepID=W2QQT1_PHYN3|nr:hypothetical protein PPTG_07626 [Phytophthora nicotianae INRA-310]ETN14620.1 hypothetical protein PPTG_07626 [Phytophthora nicotianae INRA-310]
MSDTTESGLTAFALPPAPTYRFVITSRAEKVKITLEDLKSKKQWSSGFLDDKEYVTSTNRIPNASLVDYVKVFKDTLEFLMESIEAEEEDTETDITVEDGDLKGRDNPLDPAKIRRKLTPLKDYKFQLELAVKIRIFQSAWTAKYLFQLEPVTLDRIDILEAKLRDIEYELEKTKNNLDDEKRGREIVEEELNEMKDKLADLEKAIVKTNNPKAHERLKAASRNVAELNDKGQLQWNSVKGLGFEPSSGGYGVRVLVAGWYMVNATVYLAPQTVGTSVKLQLNGNYLRSQPAPINGKQNTSVTFAFVTNLKKNDELTIIATDSQVGADLDAFRVGK